MEYFNLVQAKDFTLAQYFIIDLHATQLSKLERFRKSRMIIKILSLVESNSIYLFFFSISVKFVCFIFYLRLNTKSYISRFTLNYIYLYIFI